MAGPKIKEKSWSKDLEREIYEGWKLKGTFKFKPNDRPVYSIDTPPPYVNTPVHIGQATTYVLMDMFARYRRMTGYNVLFPLGLDKNGLPIEMATEQKFGVRLTETPREEFIELCKKVLEEAGIKSMDSFLRLGISFNSWDVGTGIGEIYETDSEDYRTLTQETFIDLYNKGLIYEDNKITNYCPGCQTTIADAEIEYKELPTTFNDIIFKVKDTGEEIIIGTTRPELVCTCGMVIFHPSDERYQHLEGKTAISPLFEREIPIQPHPMADPEKGTGLVMMCSAGDTSDIRFFIEMDLEPVIAINPDGKMNEHAGFLDGLPIVEARAEMIEKLRYNNLLVSQENVVHRTPVCERSGDHIEFIEMKEFYVKQIDFKDDMRRLAEETNFFADKSRQILLDWIDSVKIDWPISRRRYYATEVPVWHCECGEIILPEKGKYYRPWKDDPPVKECPKCGSGEIKGDERVFDTWFDSSITPLYILQYSRDEGFFDKNSPCSLRPQGKEIVRTWLYYTILKDYLLTGKGIFEDVWVNYHIVDGKGRKMSKSKGNVIDPYDVLEKFGAEPFRLWTAVEGNLEKTDFRCSFERIEGTKKTLTKLWNVTRFVSMFPLEKDSKVKLLESDEWITEELNELITYANERYKNYDFHNPATKIKHVIWETFASHYLELIKNRVYNQEGQFTEEEQNGAIFTLYHCLENILRLLYPVIPMITYKLYNDLFEKDLNSQPFPAPEKRYEPKFTTEELESLNSAIWRIKKDANVSLKAPVKSAVIPEKFKGIERDLAAMHGIENLEFGELKINI
jgi:valyl-tRNA synthetase